MLPRLRLSVSRLTSPAWAACTPPRSTTSSLLIKTHTSSSPRKLNTSPPLYSKTTESSVVKYMLALVPLRGSLSRHPIPFSGKKSAVS